MSKLNDAIKLFDQDYLTDLEVVAILADGLTLETVDEALRAIGNRVELLRELLFCVRSSRSPVPQASLQEELERALRQHLYPRP